MIALRVPAAATRPFLRMMALWSCPLVLERRLSTAKDAAAPPRHGTAALLLRALGARAPPGAAAAPTTSREVGLRVGIRWWSGLEVGGRPARGDRDLHVDLLLAQLVDQKLRQPTHGCCVTRFSTLVEVGQTERRRGSLQRLCEALHR
eukprot:5936212-Prymnesium_polylepis.4